MLYISKTELNNTHVNDVIEKYTSVINDDYYNQEENKGGQHDLPLAVAAYIEGEVLTVGDGYTVTNNLVVYSTNKGNMIGIYHDWSEETWFFFMSGKRHGIPVDYFFKELTPEYDKFYTHVYVSNNTEVSPFKYGVEMNTDSNNAGSVWPLVPTKVNYTLAGLGYTKIWRGSISKLKRVVPTMIAAAESVPIDIKEIDFSNVIFGINDEDPIPSIDIEGIKFEGNLSRIADRIVIDQVDVYGTTTITWWFNDNIIEINRKSSK